MNQVQSNRKLKVVICDDHPIVRAGFRQFLAGHPDMESVREAGNGREALDLVRTDACDVLLLDISMPGQNGIDVLRAIRLRRPELPVLMLSSFPEQHYALQMLKLGASGYLPKDCEPSELLRAIRSVSQGRRFVTEAVGDLLANGFRDRQGGARAHLEAFHEPIAIEALQLIPRLLAQGDDLHILALGDEGGDPLPGHADDGGVETTRQTAVRGGDDDQLFHVLAGADEKLGCPIARHARRQIGNHRSHALGIGASVLRSLLGPPQLGGGDHLQRFRDLLRGFHALDPIAHLLEAGHLLKTPPFL